MTAEHPQWQEIKENYLKLIEKSLAQVDCPRRTEILNNVREHLDNKYAELPPDKQNWEGYQQIITEMGPPQDYADLLTEEKPSTEKNKFGINELLAVVFVIVLIIVGGYLIYSAKKTPTPTSPAAKNTFEFESDEQVLGQWVTVDFVKTIDDFDPTKKTWQGNLFLLSLDFENNGNVWGTNRDINPYKHRWTKGKVDPSDERPAFYYLRNINGQTYLFFEWISGDVTIRGQKPCYYVLKKKE